MANNESSKIAHAQAITMLFGAYGLTNDRNRMLIYANALKAIPQELLLSVVEKTIYQNKFMPSIAELVEACRSLNATINGKSEVPDWNEAWQEIERAMHSTAWNKKPAFSHPVIAKAVNSYGWQEIQTVLQKDFHTMQAQLRRMYDECSKKYLENKRNQEILNKNILLDENGRVQRIEMRG